MYHNFNVSFPTQKPKKVLILGGNSVYHNGFHYAEYPYTDVYDWQILSCFKKLFDGKCDALVLSGSFTKGIKDDDGKYVVKSEAQGMLDRAKELFVFHTKFGSYISLEKVFETSPSLRSKIYLEENALTSYENLFLSMKMIPDAQSYEMCSWGYKEPMFDVAARTLGLIKDENYFFYPIGENSLQENIKTAKEWIDKHYYKPFIDIDFDPESPEEKTRVMERDFFNKRFSKEQREEYLKSHDKELKSIPKAKSYPANQNLSIVVEI